MKLTIVGLGLIGGCMGIDLRRAGFATALVGVDINEQNGQLAVSLGLVDRIEPEDKALAWADVVLLAIPVNTMSALLPQVLDAVGPNAVVIDTGSTKSMICRAVSNHPKRHQFVAAHPIAGTENSGPSAAFAGLFRNNTNIICERDKSSEQAIATATRIFDLVGMNTIYMEPDEHDKHVAYVSHLSHVSSFLLGLTVLDIEKDEKNIFNLAGSGLASTVRLAKSSPDMWAPIFEQNAEYLGQALAEYIMHLQRFHYQLMKKNTKEIYRVMREANQIRKVLDGMSQPAQPKTVTP